MAERIIRPRLTAREAECLYSLVAYFDEEPGCDIYEWLGGEARVNLARSGAAKLRRAVYGPAQSDDEEAVEARYQARQARNKKQSEGGRYYLSVDRLDGGSQDDRDFKTQAGAERAARKLLGDYGWSHPNAVHAVFVHHQGGNSPRVVGIWRRDDEGRIVLDVERMRRAGFVD